MALDNTYVFRPYRRKLSLESLRVVAYPLLLGAVGGPILALTGNGAEAAVFAAVIGVILIPVLLIVVATVLLSQRISVVSDSEAVTKRSIFGTRVCRRRELQAIEYGIPLRGTLPCKFLRSDGQIAFRLSVTPFRDLQGELGGLAGHLEVPLRPDATNKRFRL
jgi:hypothetical protein